MECETDWKCANSSLGMYFLPGHHVVHWSRWRALVVLIVATVLMACCADLSTENIEPFLTYSISQVETLKPGTHF